MTKTVSIPMPGGLVAHGAVLKAVTLREPTFDEYLRIGEPTQIIFLGDGRYIVNELPSVIEDYIKVCLVEPKEPVLLAQGGMKLARAVKDSILGFFRPDDSETALSKTSGSISSGDAKDGSAPPT